MFPVFSPIIKANNLKTLDIPKNVVSIGEQAFSVCHSLKCLNLPPSLTSFSEWEFESCRSLEKIIIPSTVTTIGRFAFIDCPSLKYVYISESVSIIEDGAFYSCKSLSNIVIPSNVTSIGCAVFHKNTREIFIKALVPPQLDSSFDYGTKIYVPRESIEEYRANDKWSYGSRIIAYDYTLI